MQSTTHTHPYPPLYAHHARHIGYAILLALLLHALVLLALSFRPAKTSLLQRQTLEVSLETSTASILPEQKKNPTPKPQPIPDETPAEIPAPKIAKTQPAPPSPSPAPSQNSAPAAEEIQPLFRLTHMPSFLRKTEAVYPVSERRAGIQANVLAEVTINSQGNVLEVRILKSGGDAFDEAVKQALLNSIFNPGMIDGKPVGTRFQVPFRFNLN